MYFFKEMQELQKKLIESGYKAYSPTMVVDNNNNSKDTKINIKRWLVLKKKATKIHFEKVKNANILIIFNGKKNGRNSYVGTSTFAEIAYATALNMCHKKKITIYAINPLAKKMLFYDELKAWGIKNWK